jgi:bacteriorhodopsin
MRQKRNFIMLTILAEIAFAAWAAALPESAFLQFGQYATKIAAVLIIVLAVFIPMMASVLDLVPVKD